MAVPTKRLGRGLSSLIQITTDSEATPPATISPKPHYPAGDNPTHFPGDREGGWELPCNAEKRQEPNRPVVSESAIQQDGLTRFVRVEEIEPSAHQPRKQFNTESIGQLAASIARNGLVQPLVVRPVRADGQNSQHVVKYELIAGERRWRAARAAGTNLVPVIVREIDDERAHELALIENLQREDLNAIDRAEAYAHHCRQYGIKPEELAVRLNEDRTTVVNYMRLIELPSQVKDLVAGGQLSMGHARSILSVSGVEQRIDLARKVIAEGLSVRGVEELLRRQRDVGQAVPPAASSRRDSIVGARDVSAQVAHLEERFQQALGTKVKIKPSRGKGRGKILIEYYSLDDFDRIMSRMGVQSD